MRTDPLAPTAAIPSELQALRAIARYADPSAPVPGATARVLLRHIAWLEAELAEARRLVEGRTNVVVPLRRTGA